MPTTTAQTPIKEPTGNSPMVLAQSGLEPALAALADRSPVPVRLRVNTPDRLPGDVEATAYYLVSEALTNAARHASARVIEVTVSAADGGVCVEVVDDGRGGACASAGTGLQGLADRLAAHGVELNVDSPSGGGGTRIRTVLPCR